MAVKHGSAPPDKPLFRSGKSLADRRSGTDGTNLGQLRANAVAATAAMQPAHETPTTPATPGANTWVQLGPVAIPGGQSNGQARVRVTGRITAIQIDPTDSKVIYVGTARGGVWKSSDSGYTWQPQSDNRESLAIGALALAPSDHSVLYAGTGEGNVQNFNITEPFDSIRDSYYGAGALVSVDAGKTWTLSGQDKFVGACFYRVAVHPLDSKTAWAATSNGVFRTMNGGANWNLVAGLPAISPTVLAATDVVIDPLTPATVYVAFNGDGVYRSTNAADPAPAWTRVPFDQGIAGAPSRIALAISPSSPDVVYALAVSDPTTDAGLYATQIEDGGLVLAKQDLSLSGNFNSYYLGVNVDPATPDLVYLSGESLFRVLVSSSVVTDIGQSIHADHHALAFDPADHMTIYAGTDGGIFKSADSGQTWADWLNAGICITQFESIDQHPHSDALLLGGTQDNGTEQFRNSSVFYHSDDGDGGCVAIDPQNPQNMIHEFYSASPTRSEFAGGFGSWNSVSAGVSSYPSLFYPPFALSAENPLRIAFGTNVVNLDAAQGTRGWPDSITLPGLDQNNPNGLVSAIAYVSDNLIFAGTNQGAVFRIAQENGVWTPDALQTKDLPANWIWEIATLPGDPNTVFLAMAGYGAPHVWRGSITIDAGGKVAAVWSDIGGKPGNRLPDTPVNCLSIDPKTPKTIYIGTENGVFRTQDWTQAAGVIWEPFSDGLPNTAVYDLKLYNPARLLRAATHGRGLWERQLDAASAPDSQIYVRADRMDTGRGPIAFEAVSAAFDDPWNDISLGDDLWPWETPDLKVDVLQGDVPSYQLSFVDDVGFETALLHNDPVRGTRSRLYVQAHNRGKALASQIPVRVYYTQAGPHIPALPADFWTRFPAPPMSGAWKSAGDAQYVDVLPTEPAVASWTVIMRDGDPDNYCFLVIADGEKIPAENRILDAQALVRRDRRAALKNALLVQANGNPALYKLTLNSSSTRKEDIEIDSLSSPAWTVGVLFPKTQDASIKTDGFRIAQTAEFQWLPFRFGDEFLSVYEPAAMRVIADSRPATIHLPSTDETIPMCLALIPSIRWGSGRISLVRKADGVAIGGSTVIIRPVS
jgi:photosystem II stability/assembly factor-like uncharacterized protein